jgi:hypothetical protein
VTHTLTCHWSASCVQLEGEGTVLASFHGGQHAAEIEGRADLEEGKEGERGAVRVWLSGAFRAGSQDQAQCLDAVTIVKAWPTGKARPIVIKTVKLDIMTYRGPYEKPPPPPSRHIDSGVTVTGITFRPGDEAKTYPVDVIVDFAGPVVEDLRGKDGFRLVGYGNWGESGVVKAKKMVSSGKRNV